MTTASSAVARRAELVARFTGPGAEFEIVEKAVWGIPMRVFSGGPQTLREWRSERRSPRYVGR
jgi:long-chain acyl-CoA synthetase